MIPVPGLVAFADEVELNITNDHTGILSITQQLLPAYRSGAGFRNRRN